MAETSHDRFWPELRRRGLLGDADPQRLGAGNLDRRSDRAKAIYRFARPDGRAAKLTIATDLSPLCDRAHAWRSIFPSLANAPLFRVEFAGHDFFAEEYFEGLPLESTVLDRKLPFAQIHRAFLTVTAALRNTRQPSTDALRRAEWDAWTAELLALPLWTPRDLAFLQSHLLPALARALLAGPPAKQWAHGDLTDKNLLIDATGRPRLIDPEFAGETHFHATEAARFHALSKSAAEQPGLFAAIFPEPDAATQIHFWLTQVQREATGNAPGYLTQWLPHRLATIRRLSVALAPSLPAECPWPKEPASPPASRDTAQFFWAVDGSWRESASTSIAFRRDHVQSLFFPVARRPQPWRLDPAASATSTVIRRISCYSASHDSLADLAPVELHALPKIALDDTNLKCVPGGLLVFSPRGDPQFAFDLSTAAAAEKTAWLEVELAHGSAAQPGGNAAIPADAFRLEESRWGGQPSPVALRLSGWCLAPEAAELASIQAVVATKILATSALAPRPDVQSAYPSHPHALRSGFVLELPLVDDLAFIELVAVTATGAAIPFHTVQAGDLPNRGPILGDYPAWAQRCDPDPLPDESPVSSTLRFSILLPVFNPPESFLRACVDSVRRQHYANWELCIVDDGSSAAWIEPFFIEAAQADPRIRFQRRTTNGGISRATNDALAAASGDFVVMLDHDDLLRPHALTEFARKLAAEPSLDAVYSDEDKISADGRPLLPFLKPDYSPEFLLGVMYVGHALCVRTSVARDTGGFDPAFDGVQDYEFFLRVTERTRRIGHLPRILYHWRQSPTSSALHGNVKGDMDARQVEAVNAHLRRRGDSRRAFPLGGHRVQIAGDKNLVVRTAVLLAWPAESLAVACDWTHLFAGAHAAHALPGIHVPPAFANVSRCQEETVTAAVRALVSTDTADVIVLFTAPPLALPDDWLNRLCALAAQTDSGCVAPVVLSAEGKVLESGWTVDADGARPLMRGFDPTGDGYNGSLLCSREVAAVSPLCVAVRRELLRDAAPAANTEEWLALCRSVHRRGFPNRVCTDVHVRVPISWREPHESPRTREPLDPFFNPHFDSSRANYTLASFPGHLPAKHQGFVWHLDLAPPATLKDGCLAVRGWCFRNGRPPVNLHLTAGGISWSVRCDQPRPDVAAQYPQRATGNCGFSLRVCLPPGRHAIELRALDANRTTESILRSAIVVPAWAPLRRLLLQAPAQRVAFQLMATPTHAPTALQAEKFPAVGDDSSWPKFTIVTPSFQQARFLGETMRSVLDQPRVRCDYIVQDGGSADGSVEIIGSFAARLHAGESARDHGQADAIARGFAKSTGAPTDLMAWLNSDDFYLPGALACVADYFARHPDVDVLYGNRVVVDEASREIGRWFLPKHDPLVLRLNDFVPQETLFWRRRIWDAVGGIDPTLKFAMDWDLLLRFDRAGAKIVHLPHFLACFRAHAAQKTASVLHDLGQREIDALRRRTFGRALSPLEVERHPRLARYLRRSARIEFLWRHLRIHPS